MEVGRAEVVLEGAYKDLMNILEVLSDHNNPDTKLTDEITDKVKATARIIDSLKRDLTAGEDTSFSVTGQYISSCARFDANRSRREFGY